MKSDENDGLDVTETRRSLETADAVARAAHMWIRSICLHEMERIHMCAALATASAVSRDRRVSVTSNPSFASLFMARTVENGPAGLLS